MMSGELLRLLCFQKKACGLGLTQAMRFYYRPSFGFDFWVCDLLVVRFDKTSHGFFWDVFLSKLRGIFKKF